ncbi:MAG: FAD/NAD(P)-binding protein [Desulfobacterales bacterium]|jgi:hypothetical protein
MIEWLIIGGGIHGTYLANLLVHLPGLGHDQVRILDPHETLLSVWQRNTANCGMAYLRSPATHNIDRPIFSLYRFAKTPQGRPHAAFIPPYNRPSRKLFQRHAQQVISANRLDRLHIRARAHSLARDGRTLIAATSGPTLRARRILLALGMGEQPCWPSWANRLKRRGARIGHIFDPDFNRRDWCHAERTVVLGGGITAVQTALKLSEESAGHVHLLSRHALRESQFDFNPCWIGPKCLRAFYRADYDQRRTTIDQARIPGSLPIEVLQAWRRASQNSRLHFKESECQGAVATGGGLRLDTTDGPIEADQIILATGFHNRRPGGAFIDRLIQDFDLQCNPCGYPIVDNDLRWAENIYATGPLAELQLGPCARNIVGARNAGRHLLHGLGFDRLTHAGQ